MSRTTASLVVYKTPLSDLSEVLSSLSRNPSLIEWVVVDNAAQECPSQSQELSHLVRHLGGLYIAAPKNVGFGAGHNLALQTLASIPSQFHLMVNPDISFTLKTLSMLEDELNSRPSTALISPRIVYPDGAPQFLCKLLPTPLDFALRRFAPRSLQQVWQTQLDRYELRGLYDAACDKVPFLSGCFMFTRRAALESIGGFDERYFLYLEDVDLCRRLAKTGHLLYWPHVTVVHGCFRGAYRERKLMLIFLKSAFQYFNRWGWFFDSDRARANQKALACLPYITESR